MVIFGWFVVVCGSLRWFAVMDRVQQPCGGIVEFVTRDSCNGTLPQRFLK